MHYYITGDTYDIKEDLKSCGCIWEPEKKRWRSPYIYDGDPLLPKLKRICQVSRVKMIPEKISPECQKIQDILNKGL